MDAKRIVDRYILDAPIGRGVTGVVWRAHDPVARRDVAVKRWSAPEPDARRWRREVAALRALALPGVVGLFDHGVVDDHPFLVMELVEGGTFPVKKGGAPWASVEQPFLTLLDALVGIHEAGFVHRDLKPANVMVRPDGASVILDLGLARDGNVGATLTTVGAVVGTPAYMAPEALLGERPTPCADLYSLGVLLFAALTGDVPHGAETQGLLRRRVVEGAPPLPSGVDAPIAVREAIRALLDPDPSARPTASEIRVALTRAPRFTLPEPPTPTLSQGDVQLRYAPPGAGRTLWAREAVKGRANVWVQASSEPLTLASAVLDNLDPTSSLHDVEQRALSRLSELATAGTVVVIEDYDRLDAPSKRLIARSPGLSVLGLTSTPLPGAEPIPRLSAAEIGTLFDEPEPIVHIPSDAGELLMRLTGGWPGYVAAELGRWERSGHLRATPNGLRVHRADLDALSIEGAPRQLPSVPDASPAAEETLALLQLADALSIEELTLATGAPRWRVEALVDELTAAGAVHLDGGRARPTLSAPTLATWSADQRRAAHRSIARALPPGTYGRWRHLGLGGDASDCGTEAIVRARTLIHAGRPALARAVLERAWPWVAVEASPDVQQAVLAQRARVAVMANDPAQMEEVLATWRQSGFASDAPVAQVLRAGIDAFRGEGEAALGVLLEDVAADALATWSRTTASDALASELAESRALLIAVAARSSDQASAHRARAALRVWAGDEPERLAQADGWLGINTYIEGRFDEAIPLLQRAITPAGEQAPARVSQILNLAAAQLDAGRPAEALVTADRALTMLATRPHPDQEARAWAVARHARLRSGEVIAPEPVLVDAAQRHIGGAGRVAVLVVEGFIAFRAHRRDLAGEWMAQAAHIYRSHGAAPLATFCAALAAACDVTIDWLDPSTLGQVVAPLPLRLRAQLDAVLPGLGVVEADEPIDSVRGEGLELLEELPGKPAVERAPMVARMSGLN